MDKKPDVQEKNDAPAIRRVSKGIAYTLLPLSAVDSLRRARASWSRSFEMIRTGDAVPFEETVEEKKERAVERALVDMGKAVVLALEPHERFAYLAEQYGWTEEELVAQKQAIQGSHALRLSLTFVFVLLTPFFYRMFGLHAGLTSLAVVMFLASICLKSACFFIQIEERALWSTSQLRARPGWWLYKRAFWYLD